jgi:hypothetical protein
MGFCGLELGGGGGGSGQRPERSFDQDIMGKSVLAGHVLLVNSTAH